jgi:hypothetical protein
VNWAFVVAAGASQDYRRRDRVLVNQGVTILIVQFVAWLGSSFIGFTLLLWPFVTGITQAFVVAGGSMTTLGFSAPAGTIPPAIVFAAAVSGLVIIAPQIAYLPALYAAYNRREPEVALLNARSGVPSWGPELLARTHYALGSGTSTIDTLPDLYTQWERWEVEVAESHSAYPPLMRFRSEGSLSSWVTALLAVLDSAALYLVLSPESAPTVPARLCLRAGFICFNKSARALGLSVPDEPDPDRRTSLSYADFAQAVDRLQKVDFPIERDPADAWPEFAGWRINYEQAAYALAFALDVVPAPWSGSRRCRAAPILPVRQSANRPGG